MDPEPSPDVPPSMMILDMWLPPSQEVDTWALLDVGQLGPAPRFGLLSPARDDQPGITHWKYLKSLAGIASLVPTAEQMDIISEYLVDNNDRLEVLDILDNNNDNIITQVSL